MKYKNNVLQIPNWVEVVERESEEELLGFSLRQTFHGQTSKKLNLK